MKTFCAVIALMLVVAPLAGCNMGAGNPSRSGAASPGVAPVDPGYSAPAPAPAPQPSGGGAACGGGKG
jgi:predicted small secreted protein